MLLMKIRIDQFEGPLDLLLFLIQKNEFDISAISIHKITDQYVQYIEMLRELNVDVASEFLVMAATLIHLKSKRLLPSDDEPTQSEPSDLPQTEEELVRRLVEYKKYQEAGKKIAELPMLHREIFIRPNVAPPDTQTIWKELDLTELTLVFQGILKRSRNRTKIILREPTSIPEKIKFLAQILKVGEMTEFSSIMTEEPDRTEIVVTFLALLEITRLKKLKLYQNEIFGSIYLTLIEPLTELDPTLLTGFQYIAKRIEELSTHG